MKNKVRTTYGDEKINFLARDTQNSLNNVPDISFHPITVVWRPPFRLLTPLVGGIPRLSEPRVVKCERARNLTDSTILVTPGGCSWEWVGDSTARVDAVDGLTTGQRYELTFMVIG